MRQTWEAIPVRIREAAFDHHVAALDPAPFFEALSEWGEGLDAAALLGVALASNQPIRTALPCCSARDSCVMALTPSGVSAMTVPVMKRRREITGRLRMAGGELSDLFACVSENSADDRAPVLW